MGGSWGGAGEIGWASYYWSAAEKYRGGSGVGSLLVVAAAAGCC